MEYWEVGATPEVYVPHIKVRQDALIKNWLS